VRASAADRYNPIKKVVQEQSVEAGKDYIGVGVGAVILNDEGKLFMARRGKNVTNEPGVWEFPGGKVEFGERLHDAARREIKEEFDIDIEVEELLDAVDHLLPEEGQHWVSPTFICRVKSGEPRIVEPDKCDEICWYAFDEIPGNVSQATKVNLEDYRDYLKRQNRHQ
jgi:mutator protein MutT